MITCPNCGATARNGAKFCTTCGTRLGGITPAPERVASSAPSDPEKTSTWAWETLASEASSESNPPTPAEPSTDWDWPAPFAASATSSTTASPGEAPSEDAAAITAVDETASDDGAATDGTTEEGAAMPDESSPTPGEHDELTAWAAQWNDDPGATVAAASTEIEAEADEATTADQPVEDGSPETALAILSEDPVDALTSVDVATALVDIDAETAPQDDTVESDEAASSEAFPGPDDEPFDSAPAITTAVGDEQAPPATGLAADGSVNAPVLSAGAANRATELLDELRTLIAAGREAAAPSDLPVPIASSLRDALGSESSFAALRTAAAQADEHPRDLYALMDLGRQSGDIVALLAERDRLRAAITSILGTSAPTDS